MLLDEIIELATDPKQKSVSTLLRKCLVLGTQLKNERLKSWGGWLTFNDSGVYHSY